MTAHINTRRAWPAEQQQQLRELYAKRTSDRDIAAIIGRPVKGVVNQRRKMGLFNVKPPAAVIPDDFAEWAYGKTLRQIQRRFGIGYDKACALRDKYNLPMVDSGKAKQLDLPDDFADVAPRLTMGACGSHYGRSRGTIRRWYAEAGVVPAVYVPPPAKAKSSASWGAPKPVMVASGDGSLAHSAAQHLRRIGYSNIYRATVLDRAARCHLPDEGKYHFAVSGRGFLHQGELIALAEARGFRSAA